MKSISNSYFSIRSDKKKTASRIEYKVESKKAKLKSEHKTKGKMNGREN